MTYQDFPECLSRYEWLLSQGDNAFDCAGRCKACGDDVATLGRAAHLNAHRKQLAARRASARAAALTLAQQARRLKAEASAA